LGGRCIRRPHFYYVRTAGTSPRIPQSTRG
jgi:hypothetical protein